MPRLLLYCLYMNRICKKCESVVDEWNEKCGGCGFHLVLEPEETVRAQYLKTPSLGALLFTQGWTFGSRLYIWFLLSLIPGVGLVALFMCLFFGRRWSWKQGGWGSFAEFTTRMRYMDVIAMVWILFLIASYLWVRYM